jgi:PTH1 family peptidyl-tRNA hydrolase
VYALIGLGNPGRRYSKTRHNVGYLIIDHFSAYANVPFKAGKGDYYYKMIVLGDNQLICVKPTTYMNRSGIAIKQVCDYYKIDLTETLIVCDDFNLPFGTLRYRQKGSDGGHNGLRSIIYQLQTEYFNRFRFGIGNPSGETADYVLDNFNRRETDQLKELLEISSASIKTWLYDGIDKTMMIYNRNFLSENG